MEWSGFFLGSLWIGEDYYWTNSGAMRIIIGLTVGWWVLLLGCYWSGEDHYWADSGAVLIITGLIVER